MPIIIFLLHQCVMSAQDIEAGSFESPPALFRPHRIVHTLPRELEKQQELLERDQSLHFGGFSLNARWGDGYLQVDSNIDELGTFSATARDMGFSLWLYDELGYPSGTAGGMTLMDNPEYEAFALFIRREKHVEGEVSIPLQIGELIAVYEIPHEHEGEFTSRPLAFHLADQHIHTTVTDGPSEVVVVTRARMLDGFQSVQQHGAKKAQPYVDLMNPAAVDKFLAVTHDRYAEVLSEDLGRYFFSTFTDEPSTMAQSFPMRDYAVFPWSPVLSSLLEERYGTPLEAMLPALTSDSGSVGQLARYRYFDGVAELMAENFFGRMQERCHEYNMLSGGHMLLEETMLAHVPLYGDLFRSFRRMDAPGIDMLSSIPDNMFWHTARMVSSVAALIDTPYTFSEPSAHVERVAHGYETDPPMEIMRGALNKQLLGGINCFNVYYRYDGLSDDEARILNDYVGRVGYMLTGGVRKARVALVYPIQSVWTRWLAEPTAVEGWYGVRGGDPAARKVEETYRSVSEQLYENRIEFDYVDAQALIDSVVRNGKLQHGAMAWDIVILPECDTLPMAAWEQLAALHEAGGSILALGARPANSDQEFPSDVVKSLADKMFGETGLSRSVHMPDWDADVLIERRLGDIERLKSDETDQVLRTTHRVRDNEEILFVINDSNQELEVELHLPFEGEIERMDPLTGKIETLNGPQVREYFDAYGGLIYRKVN